MAAYQLRAMRNRRHRSNRRRTTSATPRWPDGLRQERASCRWPRPNHVLGHSDPPAHHIRLITGNERCRWISSSISIGPVQPVVVTNTKSLAAAPPGSEQPFFGPFIRFAGRAVSPRALVGAGRGSCAEAIILIHITIQPGVAAGRALPAFPASAAPKPEDRCYSWSHQAAHVVGVSHAAVEGFLQDGHPRKRTSVIYNAVDPDRLSRGHATQLRGDLGIRSDDVVLISVGSLIRHKGLDVVLRALAELQAGRGIKLLIAGDGPDVVAWKADLALQLMTPCSFSEDGRMYAILRTSPTSGVGAKSKPFERARSWLFSLLIVASDIRRSEAIDRPNGLWCRSTMRRLSRLRSNSW
jgi:glycosyltransferase involved in cell wall biosynthesis